MIELLDGSDAFGKGTGAERVCIAPTVWMLVGAQAGVYLRELGGESKGRLRFVIMTVDSASVRETAFEGKFVPRKHSDALLTDVLRSILKAQQCPFRDDASAATLPAARSTKPPCKLPPPQALVWREPLWRLP